MDARWVEVMKIVDHCQKEVQMNKKRNDVQSVDRGEYPLNQFKQKKYLLDYNKCRSNNVTITLDKPKTESEAAAEKQMFPSIDAKGEI